MRGLRKRERVALTRALEPEGDQSAPLRIRVLQSALPGRAPRHLDKLQAGACPKYLDWVTKGAPLPLDARASVDPVHPSARASRGRARRSTRASRGTPSPSARCSSSVPGAPGRHVRRVYALGLEARRARADPLVKTAMARALGARSSRSPWGRE